MWLQVRFPDCFAVVHAAELIKDTQDYLDIHLDSTQNRLIRLDLITASATFSVALYTLFAGNAFAAVPESVLCKHFAIFTLLLLGTV